MESKFFRELHEGIGELFNRLGDSHPVIGVVLMLVVMPLFLLFVLTIGLGAIPGVVLNKVLWRQVNVGGAPERTKVLHDLSLVSLGAISAIVVCIYVFPKILPMPDPDSRCPTEPYC
jgi:Fe2+ transport system protein B